MSINPGMSFSQNNNNKKNTSNITQKTNPTSKDIQDLGIGVMGEGLGYIWGGVLGEN